MCKKLLVLCLMLGLSSAVYAWEVPTDYDDVQIGDWENSLDTWSAVGWNNNNSITQYENTGSPIPYNSVTGVTSGSYSLRVDSNKPSSNYWYSSELNFKFIGEEGRKAYFGNDTFSIDVATLMSEWIPNSNAGWLWGTDIGLIMNAGDNHGRSMWSVVSQMQWQPSAADYQGTYSVNYQAQKNELMNTMGLYQDWTEGWVEFVILVRYPTFESPPDGTGDGGIYYLDNAWLTGTPEPTTIALLGLGSLALLRRKR
jgi:hypothetical protein